MANTNPVITKATSISAFPKELQLKAGQQLKKATGEFIGNIASIHYTPEWNIRDICPDNVAEIKRVIAGGGPVDPIEVEPIFVDGVPMLSTIDGHHTYLAIKELVDEEKHDGLHRMSLFKGTEKQKLVRAFNSSQNLKLKPIQAARTFQRMLDEGMSRSDISRETGKPLSYISNALHLLLAPEKALKLIDEGKISSSRVGRIMREHGADKGMGYILIEAQEVSIPAQNNTNVPASESVTVENNALHEHQLSIPDSELQDSNISTRNGAAVNSSEKGETTKRAAKQSTKLRSPSKSQVDSSVELIMALGSRIDDENQTSIELNPLILKQIKELASKFSDIKSHNKSITDAVNALSS
ncbi:ParB/RepB/Spo0J family partition protein [Vibrio coralliilyticus]|uniref:ParB/RepB/Spo0J family partition protein n=1 Tax=Vibrio coralliilyticus TaxID=190893 RepID=UPI001E49A370|nr:hypothetical protein [Vibrio coralliilyticus]MCC2524927.1 hypothetical protein [Vibrio coralliilyticus]